MSSTRSQQSDMGVRQRDYLTPAAFMLGVILAGGNSVAIRFSNAEIPPFWGATIRLGLAALVLWLVVLVRRTPLPRGRAAVGVIIYGALSFGAFLGFLYWGLVRIGAGLATVVLALVPLLTLFFAFAHGLESFRWRGLLGALLAVGGIALAFLEQPKGDVPLLSLLAVAAGAASMAEGTVVVKQFPKSDPVVSNALAMTVGAAMVFALSLVVGEPRQLPVRPTTWYAILYLAIPGGVAVFSLFLFVIRRWTASATSYQFVLLPFVAVTVAALLLGETVTPAFGLGGALVLAGVWVGAFAGSRGKRGCDEPQVIGAAIPHAALQESVSPCR
jgi:drug/metabolite transporter (DMT)-like permease